MRPGTANKVPSPCIGQCQARDGLCLGCGRTLTEIGQWSAMDNEAQLARMAELDGTISTHVCPGCGERIEPQFSQCWHCAAAAPLPESSR